MAKNHGDQDEIIFKAEIASFREAIRRNAVLIAPARHCQALQALNEVGFGVGGLLRSHDTRTSHVHAESLVSSPGTRRPVAQCVLGVKWHWVG